jgi:hypothetical protein
MLHNAVRSKLNNPVGQSPMNTSTKMAFSSSFTDRTGLKYDQLFYEKPHNIRRQLFWLDPAGKMFPRYPSVPEIQKEVIKQYVSVHGIPKERMLDFWTEYVDCLLACHNFEEEAPPVFKAWAYGRLCRYVLLERSTSLSTTTTTTTSRTTMSFSPVREPLPLQSTTMPLGECDPVHNFLPDH